MKLKCKVTLLLSLCSMVLFAQQGAISSASGFFKNSSGSISFTIGEPIVATFSSTNLILAQGFQPNLVITNVKDINLTDFQLIVFPNPTKKFVVLKVENPKGLYYILYDANGKTIEKKEITGAETSVNFENLTSSTYFIKVFKNSLEIKVLKIIKQ